MARGVSENSHLTLTFSRCAHCEGLYYTAGDDQDLSSALGNHEGARRRGAGLSAVSPGSADHRAGAAVLPVLVAEDEAPAGENVACRVLAAGKELDLRPMADFRQTHLMALKGLFEAAVLETQTIRTLTVPSA